VPVPLSRRVRHQTFNDPARYDRARAGENGSRETNADRRKSVRDRRRPSVREPTDRRTLETRKLRTRAAFYLWDVRVPRVPRSNLFLSEAPATFHVSFRHSRIAAAAAVVIIIIRYYRCYDRCTRICVRNCRVRTAAIVCAGAPPLVSPGVVASVRRLSSIVFSRFFFFIYLFFYCYY